MNTTAAAGAGGEDLRPRGGDRAWQILGALAVGIVLGWGLRALGAWYPGWHPWLDAILRQGLEPIGQIFLRLLLLVVVPLVGVSIALGVLELGTGRRWSRLTWGTFGLFLMNMTAATGLGLVVMNWFEPGRGLSPELMRALDAGEPTGRSWGPEVARPGLSPALLVDLFLPRNWLRAVVDFQILPLITFALFFGLAARALPTEAAGRCRRGLEVVGWVLFRMVEMAMALAPMAVVALVSVAVARVGPELLRMLGGFVVVVLGAMVFHLVVVLGLTVRIWGRRTLRGFFGAVRWVLVTAFSTSSSAATLPASLKTARERLGISAGTAGFVLPLGATMNMSGTALYEGCVVLLVAQAYGVDLAFGDQVTLLVVAVLSAVAVASVPGASLPVIMGLLAQFGLPPEGIALVLGVDRLLDMARTTVNVAADLVTACVVDRWVSSGGRGPDMAATVS